MPTNDDLSAAIAGWNTAASAYMNRCETGANPAVEMLNVLIESFLGDVQNKRVLDAGCGYGRLVPRIIDSGGHATAVDASSEMISLAIEYLRRYDSDKYDLRVARLASLRLASQSFDKLLVVNVLQDLPDLKDSLGELARVSRPGGRLLAVVEHPNIACCSPGPIRSEYPYVSRFLGDYLPIRGWHRSPRTYVNAFIDAGFEDIRSSEPYPSPEIQN